MFSHNFIHNPFFASSRLNRLLAALETLAIGVPHVIYHHYHMNHHFGDNDAKGPDGTTKDWSSIYRHSRTTAFRELLYLHFLWVLSVPS